MIKIIHIRLARLTPGRVSDTYPFRVAHALFEDAFATAITESGGLDVETIFVDLQPYFPRGPLVSRCGFGTDGPRTVNLPILRELTILLRAVLQVLNWRWRTRGHSRASLATTNYPLAAIAVRMALMLTKIPRIVTLTDLSSFSYSSEKLANVSLWRRPWIRAYARQVASMEQGYNGYVLLSAPMNAVVNPRGVPSVVVEAVFNADNLDLSPGSSEATSVIAHAGTLDRIYGIETLLDSFGDWNHPDAELWLFGRGDMQEEIEARAQTDQRIKYFGFRPRAEVFEALKRADLLVNLRDPALKYTKYSFPSKTLEYMASGTAVATTRLEGIPSSYWPHLIALDHGTPAEISVQLAQIMALSPRERASIGMRAREFVLVETSPRSQGDKVQELIRVVLKGA